MPTNVTELKSFLGLLNYYHKFLPDLSTTLAPLHQLLQKDAKWIWSQTQVKAFQQAKSLLQSSSLLVHYDEKKPFILSCDASPYGLGAVLSHQMENNIEKPIVFTSHSLTTPESSVKVNSRGYSHGCIIEYAYNYYSLPLLDLLLFNNC